MAEYIRNVGILDLTPHLLFGSKHTLSTWYWLVLPPELDVNKVYGLPAGIALLVFLAGLLLVRSQRGKSGR